MRYVSMTIQVSGINKSYGETQVLHDVSFKCESGETLVLLGPSGAGKSSLLRVLNLLEGADNGKLNIANDVFDFSTEIKEKQGLFTTDVSTRRVSPALILIGIRSLHGVGKSG